MTIILYNNSYKYETEAIVKLFIPAVRFEFVSDKTDADGDIIMTQVRRCTKSIYLYVYVRMNGTVRRKSLSISTDKFSESDGEFSICTLLFKILSEITGIKPKWGMITGIRPVKKVNALIEAGISKDEIYRRFKEKYFISEEKMDIAYHTAVTQMPLLSEFDKKTVSIYVSVPFCPTRCSYCSFVSHSMDSALRLMPEYISKLCRELEITGEIVDRFGLKVDTVYYGGGTPTSISSDDLYRIMKKTSECFDLSAVREYNVEAGRADTITADKLEVIKKMGATRISINPQTLNNDVLREIGRNHTAEQVLDAFALARKTGFDNINMDLIAGLPTETYESFRQTIDKILELDPEGVTIHTLTLKRSANLYEHGKENINNPASQMLEYGNQMLVNHGYAPYYLYRQKNTIDNLENIGYAKKGKESLYNIYIMDETQTILGTGCAASTKLVDSNNSISRVMNYKFPYEYINRFDELMKKKEQVIEFFK